MQKYRSFLITFVTICTILLTALAVIAYGRGYRLDLTKSAIKPTGLIAANSDPVGAQVFVDNILKTATNNSFGIDPGFYTVRVSREGYLNWEKKIRVQGEVVSQVQAFLFPANPSLSPLTTSGLVNPMLSPDGSNVAYVIPKGTNAGLWYYELTEGPLGRNRGPVQLDKTVSVDFTAATLQWSPDSSELMVIFKNTTRLYQTARPGSYTDITLSRTTIQKDWETQTKNSELSKLAAFKQPVIDMATASAEILSFSPDETKILYEATASATIPQVIVPPLIGTNSTPEERVIQPGKLYVYDSKEDKNYFLLDKKELETTTEVHWFPTSRHLVLTLKGKIDVLEYDRTNWITIYSGPFVDDFVAPWTNGSRVIILTNLNGDATTLPNLYTVNLR